MRIVLDVRTISDHFPGIGRYVYHLAHACTRLAERIEWILLHNPLRANSRYDVASLSSGPNVRMVCTAAQVFTMREQLQLPLKLRSLAPDIAHFPYMIMPYAAPRPVVLTIHDVIPVRFPGHFSLWQRAAYRVSMSLALRAASFVICVSKATRADLVSSFRVNTSNIAVVHEGVAKTFRPLSRDEIKRVRAAHGLPERYLLYVGSHKPHKNLPALVDAYARLHTAPPLVLAGMEDPRYPQTRRRVEVLGLKARVRFMGAVREEELPALYSGAMAFVFPSMYEGFGLPPLEAMACGVPVACSNIPSLLEVVDDAALLFDPGHHTMIETALARILTDEELRANLRMRGFRRAAEFSWDSAAQQTLQVYERAHEKAGRMQA